MHFCRFGLALLLLSAAVVAEVSHGDFDAFLTKYNKKYQAEEYATRFELFKANVAAVSQWNKAAGGRTVYGITKFSDLTHDEKHALLGKREPAGPTTFPERVQTIGRRPKAAQKDNVQGNSSTNFNWCTVNSAGSKCSAVNSQGSCGCCWIMSAVETLESAVAYATGNSPVALSTQQSIDCNTVNKPGVGCCGGIPYQIYDNMPGYCPLSQYPYVDASHAKPCSLFLHTCKTACPDVVWVQSFEQPVFTKQPTDILNYVYTKGPLSVCMYANNSLFNYVSGIFTDPTCKGKITNHCLEMTGASVIGGTQTYIIRNSWGADWGVNGYFYLDAANACGVGGDDEGAGSSSVLPYALLDWPVHIDVVDASGKAVSNATVIAVSSSKTINFPTTNIYGETYATVPTGTWAFTATKGALKGKSTVTGLLYGELDTSITIK